MKTKPSSNPVEPGNELEFVLAYLAANPSATFTEAREAYQAAILARGGAS